MAAPIHNTVELWVEQMVQNRLPFLEETANNTLLLSNFTWEIMAELDNCFQKDAESPVPSHIGDEQYYDVNERAIVADLVAYSVVFRVMTGTMGGTLDGGGTPVPPNPKILTGTEAGSVSAEWEQFDIKKGGIIATTGDQLLSNFKQSAIRKAHARGCIIDICDDCITAISCMLPEPALFKYTPDCPPSIGTNPAEQG